MNVSCVVMRFLGRRGEGMGFMRRDDRRDRRRNRRHEQVSASKLHGSSFSLASKKSFFREDPLLPWIALIRILIDLLARGNASRINVEGKSAVYVRQFK